MSRKMVNFSLKFQKKQFVKFFSTQAWPANRVRRTFLEYYENLGCTFVPSSPVVSHDDPSLLFVNAGMNQFKSIFLSDGVKKVNSSSSNGELTFDPKVVNSSKDNLSLAVNTQKCLRVSGKHSDLDEIGRDGHHHTFFEMLGNWSFKGHVTKQEACKQAWTLLTDVYGLSRDRLSVTYFAGLGENPKNGGQNPQNLIKPDTETREIWLNLGLPAEKIAGLSAKENFWEMGDTGPCGPCTEILYQPVKGSAEQLEVWNIVFIQYTRLNDGSLRSLPNMHIDTGMGLERLCRILQNVNSNYDTDLFLPLIERIELKTGIKYDPRNFDPSGPHSAVRILADHSRACAIMAGDGLRPARDGAGHVLRRLVRNAVYQSIALKACGPLLADLAKTAAEILQDPFPELLQNLPTIVDVLKTEEDRFFNSYNLYKSKFRQILQEKSGRLTGTDFFQLYSTYGLPKDMLERLARDSRVPFSEADFESERQKHVQKSKPDQMAFKKKSERRENI